MQDFSRGFKDERPRRRRRAAARKAADMRTLNTSYGFWRTCCLAQCRRARACTDDAETCFRDHSGIYSAEQLRWIDTMLAARRGGLDWDKAAAQATRLMTQRLSLLSQIAAGHARPKSPGPALSARCRSD
jgi:hypothetical protein